VEKKSMRIAGIIISMLLSALSVCGQQSAANDAEANKVLVQRAFQSFNQGDFKTLNDVFDPKGPIHGRRGQDKVQGGPFAELKDSCPMCAALSNRQIKIDLIVAEGDMVAVRSTWSGKYSGTVRGTAVADKDISVTYTNFYRVAGGKIVENWYQSDSLSLAEQLGFKLTPPAH
jgi:ketosteroid isomerase-like protein